MTLLDRMKLRLGEEELEKASDALLEELLFEAAEAIINRRFPPGDRDGKEVEPQYIGTQLRIALDLYNKQGNEGETSHSENGVSRSYDGAWISEQLLREVVPYCKVV